MKLYTVVLVVIPDFAPDTERINHGLEHLRERHIDVKFECVQL